VRITRQKGIDGDIPLTPIQESFYRVLGARYSTVLAFDIGREIQKELLDAALERLVRRHAILRSVLVPKDGRVVANVVDIAEVPAAMLQCERVTSTTAGTATNDEYRGTIGSLVRREETRTFDATRLPLFKVLLYEAIPGHPHVILAMHHTITDGMSLFLLLDEWMRIYEALLQGTELREDCPLQYADYAYWLRSYDERTGIYKKNHEWNKQNLRNIRVHTFPRDGGSGGRDAAERDAERVVCFLEEQLAELVRRCAERVNVSENTVYLTAVAFLLRQLNKVDDHETYIRTLFNTRVYPGTERIIGPLVDMAIIRLEIHDDASVVQLLRAVEEEKMACLLHSMNSFASKTEILRGVASVSEIPVYALEDYPVVTNTIFNVWIGDEERRSGGRYYIECESFAPFSIRFIPQAKDMALAVTYATARYSRRLVNRYIDELQSVIRYIATIDGNTLVSRLRQDAPTFSEAAFDFEES
jgi:polyketide synthase PksJ